jgi:hypothetical protein
MRPLTDCSIHAAARISFKKYATPQDTICLFHFSGHAGTTVLQLEDTTARGAGMAQLLARCPNLRLVFLNGCSTLNHVKLLADQNVKAAVIATATPVEDPVATRFSIAFYQALVNQYSLKQALEQARLSIQVTVATTIRVVTRGAVEMAEEINLNQWCFYCPDDETGRWELPTGVAAETAGYVPNSILRRTLFEALRAYDPTLTQLFKTKQSMPDAGLRDWLHEEELRRLPYPISEPLRKLLCPQISFDGKLIQPQATRERLVNYINLFDASVDLLISTVLSQLRNWLQEGRQLNLARSLDADTTQLLQQTVTSGWSGWGADQLMSAIQLFRQCLDQQQVPYFIPELKTWLNLFGSDVRLSDNAQFLFTLKVRLAQTNGVSNIPSLCQLGEEHLSGWLKYAGFWAVYRLESFKNIRAVRFYQQQPAYRHEAVVLRTSQSYRNDETYFQEIQLADLWDCQSVLLVKIQRRLTETGPVEDLIPAGFLNLAPFIIDRNVFLKSDNAVFDLYSFYSGADAQLHYRHIARPDDLLLNIGSDEGSLLGKQDFSVLREQFSTLRSLLDLTDDLPEPGNVIADDLDDSALNRI